MGKLFSLTKAGYPAFAIAVENRQDGIFIPSDLKSDHFTQFAIDNLDFNENTKDGTTLHATTHVMFQYGNTDIEGSASVPLKKFVKPQERICLLILGKLVCPVKKDFKAGLLHGYL